MSKPDDLYQKPMQQAADFKFDDRVVQVFPDMINRSIPGYSLIIPMVALLARRFVTPGSRVYDLGCSLGATSLAIRRALTVPDVTIVAVDNSEAMINACRKLVAADDAVIPVEVVHADIVDAGIEQASFLALNFTLQFLPPERRAGLLRRVYEGLLPGGALVLSEKVCFSDPEQQQQLSDWHHDFKRSQGYSDLEIAQKRNALEKVMIPDTLATHHERLVTLGFRQVYTWYQCFNFCSIVAIK